MDPSPDRPTDETGLAAAFRDLADRTPGAPPDPASVRARVHRRGVRRRRVAVVAAALAVVVVAGGALALARQVGPDAGPDPTLPPVASPGDPGRAGWQRVPSPLSPRTQSLAVRIGSDRGEEALFLGGAVADLCPPSAGCVRPERYARDGAAYDPATGAWRSLAPAPLTLAAFTPHAVSGDRLVVVGDDGRTWWEYDATADTWTRLPDPPGAVRTPTLAARDGVVYAVTRDAVVALDLADRRWTSLPPSPHRPALVQRTVAAAPGGVVVLGLDAADPNDGRSPSYLLAEVWDGSAWRQLPPTGQLGTGAAWTWTGSRLVVPDPTCVDGGEVDPFPACVPQGGTLDPVSGRWAALAEPPDVERTRGGWSVVAAADGEPRLATYGFVYDDRDGSWTRLPRPAGAPADPGGATWVAGRLLVLGGVTWAEEGPELTSELWTFVPD